MKKKTKRQKEELDDVKMTCADGTGHIDGAADEETET